MFVYFNTGCVKDIRKNKYGPGKKRALNLLILGAKAKMALKILGVFQPLANIHLKDIDMKKIVTKSLIDILIPPNTTYKHR